MNNWDDFCGNLLMLSGVLLVTCGSIFILVVTYLLYIGQLK
jgi:hypothetical protein